MAAVEHSRGAALSEPTEGEIFGRVIDGLKRAEDGIRLLALMRDQPALLMVGMKLGGVRAQILGLATRRSRPLEHRWLS